ncbi:hypothetical protein PABY_17420 [Pyrodictium abyssi]|uniref:Uncharacterized protein n=2 Tax=Pyrodictium abyssi TaxID=54256 RepID=A0ABM8IXC0_9CREN|nr:hypothetical protein PABY_17420 [Pyrodictium abyssi]
MEAVRRVAEYLAAAEKCRQRYLSLIASSAAWTASLLLGYMAVSLLGAESRWGPLALIAVVAASYAAAYGAVFGPPRLPGLIARRLHVLAVAAVLAAVVAAGPSGRGSDGALLLLLALPTLKRAARLAGTRRAELLARGLAVPLLVVALTGAVQGKLLGFTPFIVATAEAFVATVAAKRMVVCGDEALRALQGAAES